jgi:hypothetical protein
MPVADRTALFGRLVAAANASSSGGSANSGEIGFAKKDGLLPEAGKAAFDSKAKTGDILGPITTSAGPQLFLIESEPSMSPSPSPTLRVPSGPMLETPALPTIPGVPQQTPDKTDELGLPALP